MSDHPPIPNPTSQTISSTDLEVDERAELTKRVIPEMRMSTAENGFTRPVVPGEGMGPEEVARWRFGVEGNAVGEFFMFYFFGFKDGFVLVSKEKTILLSETGPFEL